MVRRIYYLEDNIETGESLKRSLMKIKDVCPIEVELFPTRYEFMTALRVNKPTIILLDLMLSEGDDGVDILRWLKSSNDYKDIPVVIVSGRATEFDRYTCLEAGAIAYYTKPFFGLREFNSAVSNFMNLPKENSIVICGDLILDSTDYTVMRSGKLIGIVNKEFDLLKYLAQNNNKLLSKKQIYEDVWKSEYIKGSRTLDQYIKVIRQKVFSDNPDVIQTFRNVGYKLAYDTK